MNDGNAVVFSVAYVFPVLSGFIATEDGVSNVRPGIIEAPAHEPGGGVVSMGEFVGAAGGGGTDEFPAFIVLADFIDTLNFLSNIVGQFI